MNFFYFQIQVINIINAAQENSPVTVAQALDRVLEILRSSELYNPQLTTQQVKEEDQMTTDLVGGLMHVSSNYCQFIINFLKLNAFFQ